MLRICSFLLLTMCGLCSMSSAQEPVVPGFGPAPIATPLATPTAGSKMPEVSSHNTEVYFYEQERQRYMDPNLVSRARAEYEADQRQYRLNAQKWYGYSNARPTVGTDPMHGFAGPRWIGNGGHPSSWSVVSPAPMYGGVISFDRVRR
jgi:hypothetical protein